MRVCAALRAENEDLVLASAPIAADDAFAEDRGGEQVAAPQKKKSWYLGDMDYTFNYEAVSVAALAGSCSAEGQRSTCSIRMR